MKVIIIDDEPLVRIGIKSCIAWEEYGFEVAGQAEDGRKALELVRAQRPDIVITDIKMPNMDGIEFIKRLRAEYPQIRIIVLSCYGEFDYVREALKLGAEDYLLKLSMEPDTLLKALSKAKESILSDRQKIETLSRETEKSRYLMREDQLRKYLQGLSPLDRLLPLWTELPPDAPEYLLILVQIEGADAPGKRADESKFTLSLFNLLEECVQGAGGMARCGENTFVVVLYKRRAEDVWQSERLCEKILSVFRLYLNIGASFGISPEFSDLSQMRERFECALVALKGRFYTGLHGIHRFSPERAYPRRIFVPALRDERLLESHLGLQNSQGVYDVLDAFMRRMLTEPPCDPESVRNGAVSLMHFFVKYLRQQDGAAQAPDDPEISAYFARLAEADTYQSMKAAAERFAGLILRRIEACQKGSGRWEIARIKAYTLSHIGEDITLEKAANICGISRSYFSSLFKRETGEGFTDYMNRAKMKRALELMKENGLKVYEAAYAVGISDESYFSKLFKKYIGISPSAVRQGRYPPSP